MDGNTVSVLQQLVSNPQLVRQLKDVLSILTPHPQPASPVVPTTSDAAADLVSSSSASPVISLDPVTHSTAPHPTSGTTRTSRVTATTQTTAPPLVRDTASMGKARPTSSATTQEALEGQVRATQEELERVRRDGARRAQELEEERSRLGRQVEQLTRTVAEQKLQMAEMKLGYEAALLRKDEAHAAAIQQLTTTTTTPPPHARLTESSASINLRQRTAPELDARVEDTTGPKRLRDVDTTRSTKRVRATRMTGPLTTKPTPPRRRTPRTPSLTHADRLAASSPTGALSSSVRLDSPTPVAVQSRAPPPRPPPRRVLPTKADPVGLDGVRRFVGHYGAPDSLRAHEAAIRANTHTRSATSSAVGGGPTRSPSPLNPKRGPALPRRFIFTGLKDGEPERLSAAIAQLGEDACTLDGDLDEPPPFHTTHIVLRGTPRSVKALCGVVSGKWLVAPEYIYNSMQAGFWLDEFEEGGLRIFPPPLKCQRFLLTVEHEGIRGKLVQVIEYGGGEVVTSTATHHGEGGGRGSTKQLMEQGVVVLTSGDDLLRYATQPPA